MTKLRVWLAQPVSGGSTAAFRILFGLLMAWAMARLLAFGWVDELYVDPPVNLAWPGFDWLKPWPGAGMTLHVVALLVLALCVAAGFMTRLSLAMLLLGFLYLELLEQSAYLNHYVLMSYLMVLMLWMPIGRTTSVDNLLWKRRSETVPRWVPAMLMLQLATVYVWAGIAKLNMDWLVHGEPLSTWLLAHSDTPVIGALLAQPWLGLAMSWAGAIFDLTIVGFLLIRRTRLVAYAVLVAFHVATWALFYIGLFPWIMILLTLVFFGPDWPQRLTRKISRQAPAKRPPERRVGKMPGWALAAICVWILVQLWLPMRAAFYPGDSRWTGEGFNLAWKVMLRELNGSVDIFVSQEGIRRQVDLDSWLTPLQQKMMAQDPDMIRRFCRLVAQRTGAESCTADAYASLNGRPLQLLIDPDTNLAQQPWTLSPAPWILRQDQ